MSHPEHPFLTAVRLAAQVGAPHFYADPNLAESVVVLPLSKYQELLGVGESKPAAAPTFESREVVPEVDPEEFFDPELAEEAIVAAKPEIPKKIEKMRPLERPQTVVRRPEEPIQESEEGFYLQPVPRRSGSISR